MFGSISQSFTGSPQACARGEPGKQASPSLHLGDAGVASAF